MSAAPRVAGPVLARGRPWALLAAGAAAAVALGIAAVALPATEDPSLRGPGAVETAVHEAPRQDGMRPAAGHPAGHAESRRRPAPRPAAEPPRPAAVTTAFSAAEPMAKPAAAPPAPAPSGDSIASVGVKLLLGSLVLAALLYAAARGVRRLPIGKLLPSSEGPIRVIGRTHLGPKGSLCLLEVSGTALLVAITPGGIQTLHVWPEGRGPGADVPAAATGPRAAALPGQLRGLETRLGGNRG